MGSNTFSFTVAPERKPGTQILFFGDQGSDSGFSSFNYYSVIENLNLEPSVAYSLERGFKGNFDALKTMIEEIGLTDKKRDLNPRTIPVWARTIQPEQIERTVKDRERKIRDHMNFKPSALEDFSYSGQVQEVVNSFLAYMKSCYANPIFNHFTITNEKGTLDLNTRLKNRFMSNRNVLDVLGRFQNLREGVPSVFLTLTYSHDQTPGETWEHSAQDWHKFMVRLKHERKAKGLSNDFQYLYVLEAQESGHAHIHALIMGPGLLDGSRDGKPWLFWNGKYDDIQDAQSKHSRVKSLESFWKHGFTYVNKAKGGHEDIRNPIGYMFKYLLKTFYYNKKGEDYTDKESDKDTLGKAFLHAYRKRSFNRSRGLLDYLEENYKETFDVEIEEIRDSVVKQVGVEVFTHIPPRFLNTKIKKKEGWPKGIPKPMECEAFTTSDQDLNYLCERESELMNTREESRAMNFLLKAREQNRNFTYFIRPGYELPDRIKAWIDKKRGENRDV